MKVKFLVGLGRIFVSFIFIVLGSASIFNWDSAKSDLSEAITNWELYGGHIEGVGTVCQSLLAIISILLALGIFFQLVGGVLVCLGLQVRLGAFFLLIHLIPATVLYHHFWFLEGASQGCSFILFLKNLSIVGALMIVLAVGKEGISSGRSKGKLAKS